MVTVAGNGTARLQRRRRPGHRGGAQRPFGVGVDASGHLFIADDGNNRVREINLSTGTITTLAGIGTSGCNGDNGPATEAELSGPYSLAVDSSGDLFIADSDNGRIREVNLATGDNQHRRRQWHRRL